MLEILDDIDRFRAAGRRVTLARVVDTEGSGPRLPGAVMAVSDRGEVAGSVSGGCVESAVVTAALEVLEGRPAHLVTFGYSDEDAFAVGLTCGGTVHLFIEELVSNTVFTRLTGALRGDRPVALVSVVDGARVGERFLVERDGTTDGRLGDDDLHRVVLRDALGELAAGRSGIRHYGEHGETGQDAVTVFVESFAPAPHMVIFGAVDFTAALVRVAKVIGYRVTVCDAREVFATTRRFPKADRVVVDWPQRLLEEVGPELGPRDAVCVLTHDVRFDIPALVGALATGAGYIGAMGSRRTHEAREQHLVAAGVTPDELRSIHAPIGLDLGARTPEETAVSICAEIIAVRRQRSAGPLSTSRGPIH